MAQYESCPVIDGQVMCRTEPKPSKYTNKDGTVTVYPEQHSSTCIARRLRESAKSWGKQR